MPNKILQLQYLHEMGIQSWLLKSSPELILFAEKAASSPNTAKPLVVKQTAQTNSPAPSETVAMPASSAIVSSAAKVQPQTIVSAKVAAKSEPSIDAKTFNSIDSCLLCQSRKSHLQVLSGNGHAEADVFFICESPSADEDRQGHYLSAEIQSLFSKMLAAIEITHNYFITGLVKCHAFNEYLLATADIENCSRYLTAQLEEFQPKVIVLLGPVAAQNILKSHDSFKQLRNKVHQLEINNHTYQAVVSYHPAYLLRNPLYKKEALKDLILIKSLIKQTN